MNTVNNLNILIVGVGGQGTLLASRFLGKAAEEMGKDVKLSEVHGMSQRGGSVITCVKIGDKIHSPLICEGEADVILSFEQVEAARWISYLKKGGTIITNTQKIESMPVITGKAVYPDNVLDVLKASDIKLLSLDALSIAEECGSPKAVNVVLLGVLASELKDVPEETWQKCLESTIPPKVLDINRKAFQKGFTEVTNG